MEEFLNKNNLEHLHKIFNDENIDEISLLPLLSEEHIKLLIPSIGYQIKFKRALTTIINPPSNAGVDNYYAMICCILILDLYRVPKECKNYLLNSGYNTVH
ncbi:hypothetical protein RN001_002432 [Aquatica leii]|uniref:SAM domain-containing protein n=1 Tax=Aquatica leii TaxID=1421715 RepID=A0AAN7PPV3_9COLE|nr:hypothetical protein RN001_002432 [Aquatica leii]